MMTDATATAGFVALSSLTVDDALMRSVRPNGVDEGHAQLLAALLARKEGQENLPEESLAQLDPISVTRLMDLETGEWLDGLDVVTHGFHRRRAYELAGRTMIPAVITEGDQEHRLRVALQGNARHVRNWTTAERRLAMRNLMAQPEYSRKPWGWYEEIVGMYEGSARLEWLSLYGEGERQYVGADGKTYTVTVKAPKAQKAAAPILPEEVAGLGGGDAPIALPPMAATNATPVAQTTHVGAAPRATSNGNGGGHMPQAVGGYNVTLTPKGDSGYVQIRRPLVMNATQAIEEFAVEFKLADGTHIKIDENTDDLPNLPGTVRSFLIGWLEAQG